MKLDADWISAAPSQAVCKMLTDAGHAAHFVGGCVRNALLGAPVADIDIATSAHPEEVVRLARNAGFAAHPTGIEHGTITVVANDSVFEITTWRKDVETDGRRAVVAFADRLEDDARRRDFTMNALYADPTGEVTDPVSGLLDLADRRFRFIDDANMRIREDYLRILRFFRFFAWYGREMDADGLAACAEHAAGLETLSRERVTSELLKLLSAADPTPAIASMAQAGVLAHVLPGADPQFLGPLVHLEGSLEVNPIRRLAVLGGDTSGLRLSRKERSDHTVLLESYSNFGTPKALGADLGAELGASALLLRHAMQSAPSPDLAAVHRGASTPFPIEAKDLMNAHQGPALGKALKKLRAAWLASDLQLSRQDLLDLA